MDTETMTRVIMPIRLVDSTGTALTAGAALPDGEIRWVADPVMLTDTNTGDGRTFLSSGASHGDLPLPLQANLETTEWGHVGAINAGRMTELEFAHPKVRAAGVFADTDKGREVAQAVADQNVYGVSVDLRDMEVDWSFVLDDDGEIVGEEMTATAWKIDGATITPFPAFDTAHVIVPDAVADPDSAAPVDGEVADEIEEEIADEEMALPASVTRTDIDVPVLTAAGVRRPALDLFTDPGLDRLTAPTLDERTGRYSGHLAAWGQCHNSFMDECILTPRSAHAYAAFLTGTQRTRNGDVAVGHIVYGGGHAPQHLNWQQTARFYDDVALAVARVAVGEDTHGVWFSGIIHPNADDDTVDDLLAHPLSGDWREWNASLELLAACAVNTPGFVVPRVHLSNGRPTALVASAGRAPLVKLARNGCGCGDASLAERLDSLERTVARHRLSTLRDRATTR